jgi:large subunit ribosomal protein L30
MARKKQAKPEEKFIHIKLIKSPIGYSKKQKETIRALGLHKMHQTVEHMDTPALRGMVDKVQHLLEVVDKGE